MRSLVVLALAAGILAVADTASAHTLSVAQARAAINQKIQRIVSGGTFPGTWTLGRCSRVSAHSVRCRTRMTLSAGAVCTGTMTARYATHASRAAAVTARGGCRF